MKRTIEQKLLNPRPGGRIAEARDYGIDLTLLIENLRLGPEERLQKLQEAMISLQELRQVARRIKTRA